MMLVLSRAAFGGCERDGSRWIDSGILEELVIRFMPPSSDPKLRPPTLTAHWFPLGIPDPANSCCGTGNRTGGPATSPRTRVEYCEEAEVFIRSDS